MESHNPISNLNNLSNKDIIILTTTEWNGPRRVRQYISDTLLKYGNRILYVEGYYSLIKFIKKPDFKKFFKFLKGTLEIKENLYILSSFPFIPGGEFFNSISWINWKTTNILIKYHIKKLRFKKPILIIFAYNAHSLVNDYNREFSIYYCNDAFSKTHKYKIAQFLVEKLESKLIKKVDIIFTSSNKLTLEKSKLNNKCFTIHHAVDHKFFNSNKNTLSFSFPNPNNITIGYSGVIRSLIDIDLVIEICKNNSNYNFVFIGPITECNKEFLKKIEILKKFKNVFFMGPKNQEEIISYISIFNICWLPYHNNDVLSYCDTPLKFFEYLALGKPIISTVGSCCSDEDIVSTFSNPTEFSIVVNKMIVNNSCEKVNKRIKIATLNTWDNRIIEMNNYITRSLRFL